MYINKKGGCLMKLLKSKLLAKKVEAHGDPSTAYAAA